MFFRTVFLLLLPGLLVAGVRPVGPGQRYRTPCEAIRAAADGDVVEIDAAGDYTGDVCAFSPARLTLRGAHGRPRLEAGGRVAASKAIWVIGGGEVTVENIEFSGARSADRNGAGIRFEGRRLTVRNCVFRRNENGILTSNDPESSLLVEYSEFDSNGHGDGYSHNIYVGRIAEFTMQFCWSHDAREGHLVKSRAAVTNLLYNYFDTGAGTGSYEVNLPENGAGLLLGNLIVQRGSTHNPAVLAAGEEAAAPRAETSLRVVHNTFVNLGPASAVFVRVGPGGPRTPQLVNNVFLGPGAVTNLELALPRGNETASAPASLEPGRFELLLRALKPTVSPLPEELIPRFEYRHPACGARRASANLPGAFEPAGATSASVPGMPARCAGSGAAIRRID
ncbi:MAG: right-handed parallel beta-helix repeat-containing protein [Bryobacteraceae bacterium]